MGNTDYQLGVVDEVTYGTAVTVTKFFEYESEAIESIERRTQGDPLRTGSRFQRNDRFVPWYGGAAGSLQLTPMTKGFGFWLKHMTGAVATTGPSEVSVYTHTGTEGDLYGKSFTCQVNRPFTPSGTNQAFTYSGGKVTGWTLSNAVDKHLLLDLSLDFMKADTATALATATYPSSMEPFSWATGLISLGGTNVDVTDFSLQVDNGLDVERQQVRRNTDKKEPVGGRRSATFSLTCDFDSLTQRNRAHAALRADALAALSASWRGPALLGTTLYPQLTVTVPQVRVDDWKAPQTDSSGKVEQTITGEVLYDGTSSPISLAYQSADVTP